MALEEIDHVTQSSDVLIDSVLESNVRRNSEILNGKPCFSGTRLPIEMLFGYLQSDHIVNDFIDSFPIVDSQQVRDMLEVAKYVILKRT